MAESHVHKMSKKTQSRHFGAGKGDQKRKSQVNLSEHDVRWQLAFGSTKERKAASKILKKMGLL